MRLEYLGMEAVGVFGKECLVPPKFALLSPAV